MGTLEKCPEIIRFKGSLLMADGPFGDGPLFMNQNIAVFEKVKATCMEIMDCARNGRLVYRALRCKGAYQKGSFPGNREYHERSWICTVSQTKWCQYDISRSAAFHSHESDF